MTTKKYYTIDVSSGGFAFSDEVFGKVELNKMVRKYRSQGYSVSAYETDTYEEVNV